ncbi:MAG: four-carbon acid sugar kinase family protein [Tissierellia bacterium]|nr:four-carbon acid sugar kinase family protein [Tissierellia bacterium]
MERYLIIADDFTGANDTGVQLTKRGIKTQVVLDAENIKDPNFSYVLDTESRALSEDEAYRKLKSQLKDVKLDDFDLVYKKIDSTIRGNIVAELKAIDELYQPELIIFAPAFPDIGRTTVDEVHYVNGRRIRETEFAKDPLKPVKEDNIRKLLEGGFNEPVIHHSLKDLRDSNVIFHEGRIHTFDAERNIDLDKIVLFSLNTEKKILWVGSAGLANRIIAVNRPYRPALAIVGSLSEVSRKQMKYAEEKGIRLLKLDIADIIKNKTEDEYITQAVDLLKKGSDLIITSAYEREDYEETVKLSEELSMTKEEISMLVQDIVGKIAVEVISQVELSGVFVTGGDTAMGLLNKSKAEGSLILEEIMTGIPMMELVGGIFHGYRMVSKAGAFGNEEALYYSMEKIKEA